MKTRAAFVLAILSLFALTGSVAAHSANSTCDTINVANTPVGAPADIHAGATILSPVLYDNVGNGSYSVPAGLHLVIWPAWDQNGGAPGKGLNWVLLNVGQCEQPSSPPITPSPSPSVSPSPSPSPSPTPTLPPCEASGQPCSTPTPSATPSATPSPTPVVTPTPDQTVPPEPTPAPPTLPPTDQGTVPASPNGLPGFWMAMLLLAVLAWVARPESDA